MAGLKLKLAKVSCRSTLACSLTFMFILNLCLPVVVVCFVFFVFFAGVKLSSKPGPGPTGFLKGVGIADDATPMDCMAVVYHGAIRRECVNLLPSFLLKSEICQHPSGFLLLYYCCRG